MTGRSESDITGYTVDYQSTIDDELFNIALGATLVLFAEDVQLFINAFGDDAIEGSGRVSVRAEIGVDDGLTLGGSALFVDMYIVSMEGGGLVLGQSPTDSVTMRNISGATFGLYRGAGVTGAGSSQFVNLGLFAESDGASTIDANFYDRGGTMEIDGSLQFSSPGDVNRFIDDKIQGGGDLDLINGVLVGSNVSVADVQLSNTRIVGVVEISSSDAVISGVNLGANSVLEFTGDDASITLGDDIYGVGAIYIKGDDSVSTLQEALLGAVESETVLTGAVTLANLSNTTFGGDDITSAGTASGLQLFTRPWSGATVTIENEPGSNWTDTGDSSLFESGGSGNSVFVNDGSFVENTTGGVTFNMNVVNNQDMFAGPNLTGSDDPLQGLTFSSSVTGNGTIHSGNANVSFGGPVASRQTIDAENGYGDISIIDPDLTQFAGLINNLGVQQDIIVNTSIWTYRDFDGSALVFTNGAAETSIRVAGDIGAYPFESTVSGNTTTIVYSG